MAFVFSSVLLLALYLAVGVIPTLIIINNRPKLSIAASFSAWVLWPVIFIVGVTSWLIIGISELLGDDK